MATRKINKATVKGSVRDARRSVDRNGVEHLLVYVETSVTIKIADENFIKYVFGHERLADGTDEKAIKKAALAACTFNEDLIDKRARKVKRLVEKIMAGKRERGDD